MKKIKKNSIARITAILIAVLYIASFMSSCIKEPPIEDPYAIAKRKYRFFRCKVNGEEWHNNGFYVDDSEMEYYDAPDSVDRSGKFIINMENRPTRYNYKTIYINITRDLREGSNIIKNILYNKYTKKYYQVEVYGIYAPYDKHFYLDTNYINDLYIIDIDSTNRIITGRFEFRAITWDKQDTVLVTDGEFNWKPYWYKWK